MNRQIVRLTYVALLLVGALVVMTTYWQTWASAGARCAPGQCDPPGCRVLDRPRPHLLGPAAQATGAEPRPGGRRQDALLQALPLRIADRARRRLLHRRTLPHRPRALAERLPDCLELEPLDRRRPHGERAEGRDDPRERRRHEPRSRRPAGRAAGARDEVRRRRRARSAEREGARHGGFAELRPEPGRAPLRAHLPDHGGLRPRGAAPEPRERRALHPRLDLQGDHGLGRARVEEVHPGLELLRPRLLHRLREAGTQLRRPERSRGLRDAQPHHGPRALGELGLLQHRAQAQGARDPRHCAALRLLRAPSARDAGRRAPAERPLPERRALLPEARLGRRRGAARLRAGADARDPAADGDGGRARSASTAGSWSRTSWTGSWHREAR